jgi:hypothetical protein
MVPENKPFTCSFLLGQEKLVGEESVGHAKADSRAIQLLPSDMDSAK